MSERMFLQPAEICCAAEETWLVTVVGSCVAVCLYDAKKKVGGMCHFILPRVTKHDLSENTFGERAIVNLLREFKKRGCLRSDIRAKVLGGGHVLESISCDNFSIGRQNIELAYEILKNYGIPVVGDAVGGKLGKKIEFNSYSGEIRFHNVRPMQERARTDSRIHVLVVDDSKPIRLLLKKMIESDKRFFVYAEAADAFEAQKIMADRRPDVVTLDIEMPGMDGVSFLSTYMVHDPVPTVMVSALNPNDSEKVLRSLQLGAFHYLQKPTQSNISELTPELHVTLQEAALAKARLKPSANIQSLRREVFALDERILASSIILMGASTGGTEALTNVLARMPKKIPPIVVVQHIPRMFSKAFAERLNSICPFAVSEAVDGEVVVPNHVYIAPGDRHLKLWERGSELLVRLSDEAPVNRFRPSVDVLFFSGAELKSRTVLAALMTGMGDDGARGLLKLKEAGATTLAQDAASCVVFGMPQVARELGAVQHMVSLQDFPRMLLSFLCRQSKRA